ncbi:MAG: hypothetical protein R3C14_17125 [Caldilineaceae bacterium]
MMNGLNKEQYGQLLAAFPPHTIGSEEEYDKVQAEIDRLIDQGDLTEAETAYLDLLGTLVWAYEAQHEVRSAYTLRGVELIKGLIELHGMKQKDLTPIFKTESIVSAVLNGQRRLTADQINRLATFFHMPHELFFEPLRQAAAELA